MRTDQALPLSILMSFVIGNLDFELNVVADIRVLPHEEFAANRQLTCSNFFMKRIICVFCKMSLWLWLTEFNC